MIETHSGLANAYLPELEALGVSGSAFEVLLRLARSPDHRLRMTELAAQSTLTNSGLTRLVDRLEPPAWSRREPCPTTGGGSSPCSPPPASAAGHGVLPAHLATVDRILTGVLDARRARGLPGHASARSEPW